MPDDKQVKIRAYNKQCYRDLLEDMLKRKDGQFQFSLTISQGNILDYTTTDYVSFRNRPRLARKRNLEDVGNT